MDKVLLTESNSPMLFRVSKLSEAIKAEIQKNGMMIVRKVPSTILGEKNANGRVYSKPTLEKAIAQAKSKGLFESRQLRCTADDHPETTFPKPINASHICIDAYIEKVEGKDVLFNDWLVLNTRNGQDLSALIEAGSSMGTSIRGLGRQDESTGEITEYEYLGTDGVGNPSAGTFAPFQGKVLECVVESVSETYAKTVIESLNINSQEGKNMFVLSEAIDQFNQKHKISESSKVEITPAIVSDIIAIEKQVNFEDSDQVEMLESFKADVLGGVSESSKETKVDKKTESAKDQDVLNKFQRQLESSKVITNFLKEQNETLLEEVANLKKYKESSNKLVASLVEKAKEATNKMETELSNVDAGKQEIAEHYKKAAKKIVEDLQAEAKEVIQELEDRLEAAIQFGNLIGEHFFAQKAIAESLADRLRSSSTTVQPSKKVNTTESKIEQKTAVKRNRGLMSTWKRSK